MDMKSSFETRPWGNYTVLHEAKEFKVKIIRVAPGQSLSLQYHNYRAETWVVVAGIATVTVGTETWQVEIGETVHIPVRETHRLANLGERLLELIEVQVGRKLIEEDIVRLKDNYGRDTRPRKS
jgi:mannose-6-phosphate isomerase-like protein (cupin superfamily)